MSQNKKRQAAARRAKRKSGTFGRTAAASKSAVARKSTAVRKTVGAAEKVDLYKKHKAEYLASAMPSFVRVGPATYLAFDGMGKPGAPDFATGIGAIFNVAFTMKMAYKAAGKDYSVTKLEALWWRDGDDSEPTKDTLWNWRLLNRVPPFVTASELAKAQDALIAKGKPDDVKRVHLLQLNEDTCVQILHIGTYQDEGPTIEKMRRFAAISGRSFTGKHHEIYLSDPNKTAGDKLRTILRQPVV